MKKQNERKPGESPFYPVKPEHEVLRSVEFTPVFDSDNQRAGIIYYDSGFQNTTGTLQWGE